MKIVKVFTVYASDGYNGQPLIFDEKHWAAIRQAIMLGKPVEIRIEGGRTVILNPRHIVEAWLMED